MENVRREKMKTGEEFEDDEERPAASDRSGHSKPRNMMIIGLTPFSRFFTAKIRSTKLATAFCCAGGAAGIGK